MKSEFFNDSFEPEIVFNLQERSVDSIPDATITQESFKIVVETKMYDWFYADQLLRHLKSFGDEKYKELLYKKYREEYNINENQFYNPYNNQDDSHPVSNNFNEDIKIMSDDNIKMNNEKKSNSKLWELLNKKIF